jgi:lauroyl/myristoyl acyltransferase
MTSFNIKVYRFIDCYEYLASTQKKQVTLLSYLHDALHQKCPVVFTVMHIWNFFYLIQ